MTVQTDSRVTLGLEPAAGPGGRWPEPAERGRIYYRATLRYQGRSAAFPFNVGQGWERAPVAREVLECVLSDASMLREETDLAGATRALLEEFGDDGFADEADAKRTAKALLTNAAKVRNLLGDDYGRAMDDPEAFAWAVTDDPPPLRTPSRTFSPLVRHWEGRIGACDEGPVLLEIDLRATAKGLELAIQASTPHGGGQHRIALQTMRSYAAGWDAGKVARLAEVWDRWHLNTLRAACEHQRALGWTYDTHAGQTCPECGYLIGSAWLAEEIPPDVVEWLEGLAPELARPDPVRTYGYYVNADQGARFALEATFPEIVGRFEHEREAGEQT